MIDLEQAFQVAGNVLVIAMLVPLVAFMLFYGTRSPWRDTELGVALMGQKIAFTMMVAVIVAGNFLPEDLDFVRRVARFVLFALVFLILWLDVVNLRRYQTGKARRMKWLPFGMRTET